MQRIGCNQFVWGAVPDILKTINILLKNGPIIPISKVFGLSNRYFKNSGLDARYKILHSFILGHFFILGYSFILGTFIFGTCFARIPYCQTIPSSASKAILKGAFDLFGIGKKPLLICVK
jgi:hypothetical protein